MQLAVFNRFGAKNVLSKTLGKIQQRLWRWKFKETVILLTIVDMKSL